MPRKSRDVRALIRFLAQPSSELRAAALLRSRMARISDGGLLALAGEMSASLVAPEPSPRAALLGPEDRSVLELARRGVREWMPLVDRLPPAELLDHVLQGTAYAFELRGPNARQARANLRRDTRPGPAHPEPRLRDHGERVRADRAAIGRHVERRRGGVRRGQSDDGACRQGARVSGRVPRRFSAAGRGSTSRRCASRRSLPKGSRRLRFGRIAAPPTKRSAPGTSKKPSGCCT